MTVIIDGVRRRVSYDRFSGARGHQYLIHDEQGVPVSSHAFPFQLEPGMSFRTNGHSYRVVSE